MPIKVSVIVPVYNTEKYLGKCLESLINQTLSDIEIIVVNDGSTDGSQDIIDSFAEKHPDMIIALWQENEGQGGARNNAVKYARGEYIGFCDSDDWVEADMYEIMFDAAKSDGSDVVMCDLRNEFEIASEYERYKDNLVLPGFTCKEGMSATVADFVMQSTGAAYVCNKIFKRELLLQTPFIAGGFYEDVATTPIILSNCKKISYVKKALYHYLRRVGSTVSQTDDPRNLGVIDAWKRCLAECNPKYGVEAAYAVYFSLCYFLDAKKAHMAHYVMFFIQNNDAFKNNEHIEAAIASGGLANLFTIFGKYLQK